MLILWQSHHDIYVCTPSLVDTLGGDGMDSTLEWVLATTSLRAKRLRPPLPEARCGQCLSIADSPRACLTGGSGLCSELMREVGGAHRW
jgi:hypothetical protein